MKVCPKEESKITVRHVGPNLQKMENDNQIFS